jgi:tetraacyldisaccharide 4'-kinase
MALRVHSAAQMGDEALLLARAAPTFVSADRPAGARAIEASGAEVIVMDDGFQNPSLCKDLALVAVDAAAGLGNRCVLPAGPLRAPLQSQLRRAGTIVAIGGDVAGLGDVPVLRAEIVPAGDVDWLRAAPVLAFTGIGRPSKFFATLEKLGAQIAAAVAFPDHHRFTPAEAAALLAKAENAGAQLVTTEKDWVRIGGNDPALARLRTSRTLPITLAMPAESRALLRDLLLRALVREGGGAHRS